MVVEKTLIIVGPGGIGKSPLSHGLDPELAQIDPYRMRSAGPRDKSDRLYVAPRLREELRAALQLAGHSSKQLDPNGAVEWFPDVKILFFQVRADSQLLILAGVKAALARTEIYAPIIPTLLATSEIGDGFGHIHALVLNPATTSMLEMDSWDELKELTARNCSLRGDQPQSISERVLSIEKEEAAAWKAMIEQGALEFCAWPFAEYCFKPQGLQSADLVQHQIDLLLRAKSTILAKDSALAPFFKTDLAIREISQPVTT